MDWIVCNSLLFDVKNNILEEKEKEIKKKMMEKVVEKQGV